MEIWGERMTLRFSNPGKSVLVFDGGVEDRRGLPLPSRFPIGAVLQLGSPGRFSG